MVSGLAPTLLVFWASFAVPGSALWMDDVDALTQELAGKLTPAKAGATATVFVQQPVEDSKESAYYPFLDRVRRQLADGLANRGITVRHDIAGISAFLSTRFSVKPDGLTLNTQIREIGTGNVISGKTVFIQAIRLESGWNTRTLRDVAYELVDKMLLCLLGEEVTAEIGEFTGAKERQSGLVSVFSRTIQGYVEEELVKKPQIKLLAPEARARAMGKVLKLRGQFMEDGQDVVLRMVLLDALGSRDLEKANVSARFPLASLPPNLKLFPPNLDEAVQSTDPPRPLYEEAHEVRVTMWMDKPDRIYRPGDKPSFFLQAQEDCYLRVYYIQSNQQVFQIFPTRYHLSARIPKDQPINICESARMRIEITGNTLGQEFVKVFASRAPIDDSLVKKELVEEYGFYEIQPDYAGLREALGAPPAYAGAVAAHFKPLRPTTELSLVVVP